MTAPHDPQPSAPTPRTDHLLEGFHRLLEAVHLRSTDHPISDRIDAALQKISEVSELTREEIDHLGDYLRRDLHDAAHYLNQSGSELKAWLRLDLALVEDRLLDMVNLMADETRSQLNLLAELAEEASQIHTGQIVSLGTLECQQCHHLLHFYKPGRVPPCPKCHQTHFSRSQPDEVESLL